MNAALLGALIGAIPGTIAAVLATWASIRTNRLSLEQIRLTQVADHQRWLRENRTAIYIDLLRFFREAQRRRSVTVKAQEVTNDFREAIKAGREVYFADDTLELIAKALAFSSSETDEAAQKAWNADRKVWNIAHEDTGAEQFVVTDELKEALRLATIEGNSLIDAVRNDLQNPL